MLFLGEIALFSFFVVVSFYFPGTFILNLLKINFSKIDNLAPSLILGILFYSLTALLFIKVGFSYQAIFLILLIFNFTYFYINRKVKLHNLLIYARRYTLLFVLILLIAILQATVHLRSGLFRDGNLEFTGDTQGVHDPMHHLALIAEIRSHFPFQNPSVAGEPLANYHFFADLLIASILETFPAINTLDLYFRIFPIFISIFFSLSIYSLASSLTKKEWVKILAVVLVTLGNNAAYLLPILKINAPWSLGTFMLNQPFDFIFNPHNYIAYSFFLVGAKFLIDEDAYRKSKKLILAGIILASSFLFKVYAAAVGLAAFSILTAYQVLIKKRFSLLFPFFISVIIAFFIYSVMISDSKSGLYFIPGWSLAQMVESPDRLNIVDWTLKLQHYQSTDNIARQIQIYTQEVLVFIFGNLGIRSIGFFYILLVFLRKHFKQSASSIFFLSVIVISLAIPLLFNQTGSPYDIFQFGHYALIISAILTALAVEKLAERFSLNKKLLVLFVSVVILLAIPTTVKTIQMNLRSDKTIITGEDLKLLNYLKENTKKDSVIFIYPSDEFSWFILGLGERRVYYSNLGTFFASERSKARITESENFIQSYNREQRLEFLKNYKIGHLFLRKNLEEDTLKGLINDLNLNESLSTQKYSLYKTF